MIVIGDTKILHLNFDMSKDVKHEIEFIIKKTTNLVGIKK